ncbi:MAG: serine/threonine protein kinase [Lachnospiraceae bacterium]|nr:serine/threonine protein kinase [Lachnospiraceae bacterium]
MENNVISMVWPEWSVRKQLGKGAYGTVYEAVRTDYAVESKAAIKVITIPANEAEIESLRADGLSENDTRSYLNGIVNDFVGEIQLMESFKGVQNIVSVEDYKVIEHKDRVGWTILIRMELLTPLNAFIGEDTLPEKAVLKLGKDICTALEICALKKVIHRDIKPENIFVNQFGDYKLGDFGVARKLENVAGALSQKGTYNYMAPEIEKGFSYNATVDLYSLGLVLYRFLNRKLLPFLTPQTNLSPNERVAAVRKRLDGEPLPAPMDASPEAAEVVLKACAYDPKQRFRSATEMKRALDAVINGTYNSTAAQAVSGRNPVKPLSRNGADDSLDKTVSVRSVPGGTNTNDLNSTVSVAHRAPSASGAIENAGGLTGNTGPAPGGLTGAPVQRQMPAEAGNMSPNPYRGESTIYRSEVGEFGQKKSNGKKILVIVIIVIGVLILLGRLAAVLEFFGGSGDTGKSRDDEVKTEAFAENVNDAKTETVDEKNEEDPEKDTSEPAGQLNEKPVGEETGDKVGDTENKIESFLLGENTEVNNTEENNTEEKDTEEKNALKDKVSASEDLTVSDFDWFIDFMQEHGDEDFPSVDFVYDSDEFNGSWKCLISEGSDSEENFFDCPGILCTMEFDIDNDEGVGTAYPYKIIEDLDHIRDDNREMSGYDLLFFEDGVLLGEGDGEETFYVMFYRDGNTLRGFGSYYLEDGTELGIMLTR